MDFPFSSWVIKTQAQFLSAAQRRYQFLLGGDNGFPTVMLHVRTGAYPSNWDDGRTSLCLSNLRLAEKTCRLMRRMLIVPLDTAIPGR